MKQRIATRVAAAAARTTRRVNVQKPMLSSLQPPGLFVTALPSLTATTSFDFRSYHHQAASTVILSDEPSVDETQPDTSNNQIVQLVLKCTLSWDEDDDGG
jgi:hypothetical protein